MTDPQPDQPAPDTAPKTRWQRIGDDLGGFVAPAIVGLGLLALVFTYPILTLYAVGLMAILTPIVLIHEWGHYRVAKKAGLGVTEFSVGFGKRLWSTERNGVKWSVKVLPLGGSVEVQGMTVEQAVKENVPPEKAFINASPGTRLALALAGVRNNLLLSWLGFTVASVGLAPNDWPLAKVLALAPVNGVIVTGNLLNQAAQGLFQSMLSWSDHNVSSILSMPQALQDGVASAINTGMPLWVYVALIFALINLSLALFNLLPLFGLDGYHALIALVDGARSWVAKRRTGTPAKPLSMRQLAWYNYASGTLLVVFVLSIFVRDIIRMATTG